MALNYGGILMKKVTFYGISACLSLSLLTVINPLQATNFEGKEKEYITKCASSSLTTGDKEVCTEFNNYLKTKNEDLKKQISSSQTNIANTQTDIDSIQQTLMTLNDQIVLKEDEIAYLDISISNLELSINSREAEVRERMYAMQSYINSNSFIDFVFGASNFADMLSRMDSVEELTDYDKQLITGLHDDKLLVEEQRVTTATAKSNLEEQKIQQASLQTQYIALLNEQSTALKEQQDTSAQLEEYSEGVESALAELAEKSKQTQIFGNVTPSGDSEIGLAIAKAALSQKGKPYTWGATGPNSFDCSGLVFWAYQQAGVKIGRTTASGYSTFGQPITLAEAQAGDVVTFFGYGYVCHIGIFIDNNGTVVHAAGQANEINGQWGGNVRVNHVSDVGLRVHNYRRMY